MSNPRVMIVDDSLVIRSALKSLLTDSGGIDVVAVARDGHAALRRLQSEAPDVIVLDVEMPGMNGLETLARIRELAPRLPVIMFSTLTAAGATATVEALSLGASDYMTKPSNLGDGATSLASVGANLAAKIRSLHAPAIAEPTRPAPPEPAARPAPPRPTRIDVVVIGVSTGGPAALAEIVPRLPGDLGVPVLLVQHMPPLFVPCLAERLDKLSKLDVAVAEDGEPLRPGTLRIAPGDWHMLVASGREGSCHIELAQSPPEQSCRPAVDPLFRSAAAVHGAAVLAVVLTGMGQDALGGCREVVAAGGRVLVQDEPSSVVWGMPGFVARAGLAERELPLAEIPAAIHRLVTSGRTR